MKKSTIILFGLVCLALVCFIAKQYFDIVSIKTALTGLTHERDLASSLLKTREDELKGLQQRLKNLNEQIAQAEDAEKQTNEQMDDLGRWLGKVSRLKNYLQQHPEYAIADMKFLTTKDWLEATRSPRAQGDLQGELQSEVEYRFALAKLRLRAKVETLDALGKAGSAFRKANDGSRPQNLEDIIPYLPQDIDSSILARYTNYQPGVWGEINLSEHWIIMEARPVDDLWDGTIFLSDRGQALVRSPDFWSGIIIKDAMSQYEKEHGTPPTDFNQINLDNNQLAKTMRARGVKIDKTKAPQIFKLMMTPVK